MSSWRPEGCSWQRLLAPALCAALGCGSDASAETGAGDVLRVQANLTEFSAEAADAIVVWDVSSGPDYLYLWGRAPMRDGRASLELANPPPSEALNSYGVGVGFVVVLPSANIARTGRLTKDDRTWLDQSLGASERHAILYVDHAAAERAIAELEQTNPSEVDEIRKHWLFDFPDGYACGEGRPPNAGEYFDRFAPVDCAALKIAPGKLSELQFPNWT